MTVGTGASTKVGSYTVSINCASGALPDSTAVTLQAKCK
jgi:hypothetical protein